MAKKKKEETYEVEKIVSSRGSGKKKEYLVKWVGYSSKENTWEPIAHLSEVQDLVDAFEKPAAKSAPKPAAATPKPAKEPPAPKAAPKPAAAPPAKKRGREPEPEPKPAKVAKAAPKEAPKKAAVKAKPAAAISKKKDSKVDISAVSKLLMAKIAGGKDKKEKAPKEKAPKEKAPKEKAAKPTAKSSKKKKVEDDPDVSEVEKILAMRVDANGGLEFQISWKQKGKTGKVTWEPEDNIMDDDLVDEFEEAQQTKAYASDNIKTGSEVEVKNVMEGFQNSWTLATVTSKKGDKFSVSYKNYVDDDGNNDTEKGVERSRLRLPPSKVSGWTPLLGEIIEVSEDDCWWEAKVLEKKGKTLSVMFRVSDETKNVTLGAKTRPCSWLKLVQKK